MSQLNENPKYGVPQVCGVRIARPKTSKGSSPTLDTVHRIELVLRDAAARGEGPLSYNEVERRLPVKKARREATKAAIAELERFHLVAQGSKGVMWVFTESDEAWNAPTEPLA